MIRQTLPLLILLLALSQSSFSKPTTEAEEYSVYQTRAQYATQMLSFMNPSVQPCDDFYAYACGNWKNTIKDRLGEERRLHFFEINYFLTDIVANYLQKTDINDVAPEYEQEFQLAKKFYGNCLESDLTQQHKSTEYLNFLESIGGFPALDSEWNPSQFSWVNMSAHLNNYGVNMNLMNEFVITQYPFTPEFYLPLYGFGVELHDDTIQNTSSNEYQLNKKRMQKILADYEVSEDKAENVIEGVFEFLRAVLSMTKTFDESQEKCEEMNKSLDTDSAIGVMKQIFSSYFDIAWEGKFDDLKYSDITCIYFQHELNKICNEHKEAVANYLSMKFIYHMDSHLHDAKLQQEYCTDQIWQPFFFLFDHLYMKTVFTQDIADDVESLSQDIRKSLHSVINNANWLDDASRNAAVLKLSAIKFNIGRLEDTKTHKILLHQFKNLQFVEGSYDANKMNLQKFKVLIKRYFGLHLEDFDEQLKPLDILKAMLANAFYYNFDNTMYIKAGVLQAPLYQKDWPLSLKLGTMGYTIGHEIGHGFDSTGSLRDYKCEPNSIWSDDAQTKYQKLGQCLVEHFNNYTVVEINRNINGELTLNENMADATGLLVAYTAYRQYVDGESWNGKNSYQKEQGLPGLDVTPDQLFFLGAAQLWCSDYKESHYWKQVADYHTIDKYRVLGMLSNNNDFANAFNCPRGSKMNPLKDKCNMW